MRYILIAGLLLSGCATQNYTASCNMLATDMGKDQTWLESCYKNENVWKSGIYERAETATPKDLCAGISINYEKEMGQKFKEIADARGIECTDDSLNKSFVVRD